MQEPVDGRLDLTLRQTGDAMMLTNSRSCSPKQSVRTRSPVKHLPTCVAKIVLLACMENLARVGKGERGATGQSGGQQLPLANATTAKG